jgi:nitrogen-specific signal transduction histidine kinase
VASDVEQIRQTALRGAQIASQLMTFARQDNAPATTIDLSLLIAEMLNLLRVSVSKSAVLETELAPDLPLIRANPSEIRQVVMNLIINASEALTLQRRSKAELDPLSRRPRANYPMRPSVPMSALKSGIPGVACLRRQSQRYLTRSSQLALWVGGSAYPPFKGLFAALAVR